MSVRLAAPPTSAFSGHGEKEIQTGVRGEGSHWFFFRGGEPAHRIASRSETRLLTACGLHFHPLSAAPIPKGCNGPKCRTCVLEDLPRCSS